MPSGEGLVPLESVLCTEELHRRPSRPPDYEAENRALLALVEALADSPRTILQTLADTILEVFQADSAGLSLLTDDGTRFYWPAIAGAWKPHLGEGTPRDFGPCGDVLDRDAPLLFKHFEQRYPYLLQTTPRAEEALLIPFYVHGRAVGTLWAMAHDHRRRFDAEDLRQLESLGRFASTAYQTVELAQVRDSRFAALNLMEDAIQARQAMEALLVGLRASEERYRTLFESIDEGFCVIEKVEGEAGEPLDFRYVEANPAFAAQSGVTGVLGRTIRQAFPGEPEEWFLTYDDVVRTGEPKRFERALVTQGRTLELYAFRVDDDTQRRVAVIFKDITERKQAEGARARVAAIVESSEDAIVSKDLNGIITSWNQGAQRLFGYSAREAIGQPVSMLIPPDRENEEPRILGRIRRGETISNYETVRLRKDGSLVDISLTVSPIKDDRAKVIGASKIARDITERRRAEDAVRQAAEALRESARHKDEFLAMLAHELRNPLAPIRNSLGILRRAARARSSSSQMAAAQNDGSEAPRLSEDSTLDVLERQVGQMVRLVDDLLDAGRISRGMMSLRRERVELASAVYHVVDAARPLCEEKRQELTVTLTPDPVYLNADPARLAQIVGNLLNNACKFTDKGGRIWLTMERGEASTADDTDMASSRLPPHVVIRVRDTGIGIAADQLERVFEMFTQVDTSLERSVTGLGIGLTLVKTLAQMHGGTVEANSAGAGQGSEFVVRLPVMEATPEPGTKPATTEPSAAALRMLVVDDNRDAATSLAMLLEFSGHEVHTAYDGMEALEATDTLQPDVVLLDIGLPGLNGYEAARRIRDRQTEKRPVLVALTGWGQEENRRRSAEAGFDAHMVKPVDHLALLKLLGELGAGHGN